LSLCSHHAEYARAVVVNANQFRVISQSVKKTDPDDARNPALYLAKDSCRRYA
jgi:hypothetical protein